MSTESIVKKMREEWRDEGRSEGRSEGRIEGRDEGRVTQARVDLRRVLTVRKLAPSAADEAQIDACTDLATLAKWFDQALIASSAAEALRAVARPTAQRRRAARSS